MTFKILIPALILSCSITHVIHAEPTHIAGSITHSITLSNPELSAPDSKKEIQLLKIELSDQAKELLQIRAKEALAHEKHFSVKASASSLPSRKELGMNQVPVLDQGIHGTCVTFAITAAIDAIIGKGDYVSQLCHLQLGTYLENHGYEYSGWERSFAINVLHQIEEFGIVNKQKQHKKGCGGLYDYPAYSSHNSKLFMDPEAFHALSEFAFGTLLSWSDILAFNQQNKDPDQTLLEVKEALNNGDRLVFGVMLPSLDLGTVGAVGKHNSWLTQDSWVLTKEVLDGVPYIQAGHEMVITGYDDKAYAVDNHWVKHRGLLTLRNSWSSSAGYYGEFYMSYDYFKLLAIEVKRFTAIKNH